MFKGFGTAVPKPTPEAEDQPVSWQELFEPPNTSKYLEEAAARKNLNKQREQSHALALNGGAGTSESCRDNDNDFSAPSSSNFDRPTPRPRTSIGSTASPATTTSTGFTGFLTKPQQQQQPASAVSTDSGAHSSSSGDGFNGFGGRSAPDPFEAQAADAAAAAAARPADPAPYKQAAAPAAAALGAAADSSSFGGFGAGGGRATFAGLSASPPRPAGIAGFDDFGGKSAPEPVFEDGKTEKPAPGSFGNGGSGVGRMLRAAMTDSVRTRDTTPDISSPKATVAPPTKTPGFTGFASAKKPAETGFAGFGAGKKVMDTGFGAGTSAAPAVSTVSSSTRFTGFLSAKKPMDTGSGAGTTTAPAVSTVSSSTGFTGFASAKKPTETGFAGFGAGTSAAPTASTVSSSTGFTGFGAGAPAVKSTFPGFGAKAAAPEATTSGFTGFGVKRNGEMAPEKTGFTGFGTMKKATDTAATTGFTGFGTMKKTAEAPPIAAAPSTTGFTGFGAGQKTTVAAPSTTGFTGFGATQKTTVAPPTTPAPSGFPTATSSTVASTGTAPGTGTASVDRVQMNFGTLHVSGPPHLMNALAENERRRRGEMEIKEEVVEPASAAVVVQQQQLQLLQEERPEPAPRSRRVRFEDDVPPPAPPAAPVKVEAVEVKREAEVKKEVKEEELTEAEESEDDGPLEPPEKLFPWGKRPNFREMLSGGKKLFLLNTPKTVTDFFLDQVYRSYGCTYDNGRNMFYATSPGERGKGNGQVVALRGNCAGDPIVVASGLVEPAAIAVYEPGLSVCVVTNRGIFVLTERFDNARNGTGKFLTRQISRMSHHRGICATAGGGIISCGNGRIRMFDGNVAHGDERVLAEANYDMTINNALFATLPNRRNEKSNCCFMDVVGDRLVMSDLQKHVISLWKVVDAGPDRAADIQFVHAVDVAVNKDGVGKAHVRAAQIPMGKCAYAAGIRLDANGWVMCADAEGRTLQIYDEQLQFVQRVETTPNQLPYVSGLYIEAGGHLMVCDRKSEMGGLRVYTMESKEDDDKEPATAAAAAGFAAAARLHQGGRRF